MFHSLIAERKIEKAPILEVCRKKPGTILAALLACTSEQARFYTFTGFIFAHGTTTPHASRDLLLAGVLAAVRFSVITIPLSGCIGRKTMYIIGCATMKVYGFVYFALIDTGSSVLIFIAMMLSLVPHDIQYGPRVALMAESFTPRLRYSGASIAYQPALIPQVAPPH